MTLPLSSGFLRSRISRVSLLYFYNFPDIYFHDIHSFPRFYHVSDLSDEPALSSPSWECEGQTAVFAERKLWGYFCFECHCDSFGLFLTLFLPVCVCIAEPLSRGPLCDCPLPNPEMSFHLWTEHLDICEWLWAPWGVQRKLLAPVSQTETGIIHSKRNRMK